MINDEQLNIDVETMVHIARMNGAIKPHRVVKNALYEAFKVRLIGYIRPYMYYDPKTGRQGYEFFEHYNTMKGLVFDSLRTPFLVTSVEQLVDMFRDFELKSDRLISKDMIISRYTGRVDDKKPTVSDNYDMIIGYAKEYIRQERRMRNRFTIFS